MSTTLLSLTRPSAPRIRELVQSQADAALTYDAVGGTRGALPVGFASDDQQCVLGHGEETFRSATAALDRWTQFDLSWVWPVRTDVPIEAGALFAFVSRSLGVWSVNVCRVVYVIDASDADEVRYGFAYGTVGLHSVRGEECFLVTWDRDTDEVRFRIRKFSEPANRLLAVLGPVTRWVQGRFTRDALARLAAEVSA